MNHFSLQSAKRSFLAFSVMALVVSASAQTTNSPPSFDEVYKILREHVVGITGEELNNAAVRGLLDELESRVSIVKSADPVAPASQTNALSRVDTYDKHFAYFRFATLGADVADKFQKAYQDVAGRTKTKGVVLDLRFSGGDDYAAAAHVVDQFVNAEQPLINWGTGALNATKKTNGIAVPVVVLINGETRGAAEALAAALRETKVALLIGTATAGQASIFKEFPLTNGQRLRVATSQITVGKRMNLGEPLKPDIEVRVTPSDETSYMEDPYRAVSKPISQVEMTLATNTVTASETNRPRTRINEAELVRRKREGLSEDEEFVDKTLATMDAGLKVLRDPALARAIDLLKGLAVIHPTRPL